MHDTQDRTPDDLPVKPLPDAPDAELAKNVRELVADDDLWQAAVVWFKTDVAALDGPLGDLFRGIAAVHTQFLTHAELDAVTGAEETRINRILTLAIEAHAQTMGER